MPKHRTIGAPDPRRALGRLPLAVAISFAMLAPGLSLAQEAEAEGDQDKGPELGTVSVTAQKREENLQEVPISMLVLDTYKLREMQVQDFDDFARLLPSVSFEQAAPGFAQVYMRGVASGSNGNHSGPQPSVGIYLDEQPITTIQGALDIHMYDVQRVEALAGPQGTLYGASSQSGTLRIITNKPEPAYFQAGYGVEVNSVSHGGSGHVAEAFVNAPINERAAIRLVGWNKRDAGYIDNRLGTRTYPTAGITIDNAEYAEEDYNDVRTDGVRAALRFDLGDSWTIAPTIMAQRQVANGNFAYDTGLGELQNQRFRPEQSDDRWRQAALTVQGRLGNFDLTYVYSDLTRDVDIDSDYSDYSFWYDTLFGYTLYGDDGATIDPTQYIQGIDGYRKRNHELRLASPVDARFRAVAGVYVSQQSHEITQRYRVDGLADGLSVTGWPDTLWLTRQTRQDRDEALFGQIYYDITDKLTASAGARFFQAENGLKGFFGFSEGYFPGADYGEAACQSSTPFQNAPCTVFDKVTEEDDWLGRLNLTYQMSEGRMLYATWSEGYRPGGINRRGTLPPYFADFLTSTEFGWKFLSEDSRLLFNGAVFEQRWDDFQFAILGANGLTEIKNAAEARIRGLETDLSWAATYNLTLSGGIALYDAELTADYCGFTDLDGNPVAICPPGTINPITEEPVDGPQAPAGTRLPITAKFKGNLTARYAFDWNGYDSFFQGSLVHEGKRRSDLRDFENDQIFGDTPSYESIDLSAGIRRDNWSVEFYVKNLTDQSPDLFRFTQCAESTCGEQVYATTLQPRTIGIRFSQDF